MSVKHTFIETTINLAKVNPNSVKVALKTTDVKQQKVT